MLMLSGIKPILEHSKNINSAYTQRIRYSEILPTSKLENDLSEIVSKYFCIE